ncbi:lysozyme [Azohydromonas caseinilytica]|uniref:Lysozyme n=1 Tax=Azohydromonas caseinilytica TaxID=2728836 RepID=A0A848FCH8_9BURK|nr:lysozyme [Azohydromonas caseinilytica]NML16099.1 lysozyme [Azohydromonas caseinilytica]
MNVSDGCIGLIKTCEGFRTTPYRCPAGIPTIGYGSTRYADGRAVSLSDPPISEARACDILRTTLKEYENAVTRYVTVPLNQNQFDALVDFAYNAGAQNLRTSTLLRRLNAEDYVGAAQEFGRWIYGGGKVLPGLVRRRKLEKELFLKEA